MTGRSAGSWRLCRTSKCAERLTRQFAERSVKKIYLCVVRGRPQGELELEDWLIKDAHGMVRVAAPDLEGAKRARLTAKPLAALGELTLMQVELHTGRSHQIRVQMCHAGFPLWGDNRYGGGIPGQQIALWAAYINIEHPTEHDRRGFVSLPPRKAPWNGWNIYEDGGIIRAANAPKSGAET